MAGNGAVQEAVRRGVDGGLRSDVLACNETWLVAASSIDACPATGEGPEPGCVGNRHVNYFHVVDGFWTIVSVDDCAVAKAEDPSFPDDFCRS